MAARWPLILRLLKYYYHLPYINITINVTTQWYHLNRPAEGLFYCPKDCLLAIVVLYSEKLNTLHNLATPKVVQSFTHAVFGNSGRLPNGICCCSLLPFSKHIRKILKTYLFFAAHYVWCVAATRRIKTQYLTPVKWRRINHESANRFFRSYHNRTSFFHSCTGWWRNSICKLTMVLWYCIGSAVLPRMPRMPLGSVNKRNLYQVFLQIPYTHNRYGITCVW